MFVNHFLCSNRIRTLCEKEQLKVVVCSIDHYYFTNVCRLFRARLWRTFYIYIHTYTFSLYLSICLSQHLHSNKCKKNMFMISLCACTPHVRTLYRTFSIIAKNSVAVCSFFSFRLEFYLVVVWKWIWRLARLHKHKPITSILIHLVCAALASKVYP